MMTSNLHYRGRPLLRLFECYVLRAIDRLPATDADTLVKTKEEGSGFEKGKILIYIVRKAWLEEENGQTPADRI